MAEADQPRHACRHSGPFRQTYFGRIIAVCAVGGCPGAGAYCAARDDSGLRCSFWGPPSDSIGSSARQRHQVRWDCCRVQIRILQHRCLNFAQEFCTFTGNETQDAWVLVACQASFWVSQTPAHRISIDLKQDAYLGEASTGCPARDRLRYPPPVSQESFGVAAPRASEAWPGFLPFSHC